MEPRRTCIGCREVFPQKDMIRVAADKSGAIVTDPKGTHDGRGAYVCKKAECIAKLKKQNALSRTFKKSIDQDTADRIIQELNDML
jgi:predicted RNA-binding protein YlxR (DUF448 family)